MGWDKWILQFLQQDPAFRIMFRSRYLGRPFETALRLINASVLLLLLDHKAVPRSADERPVEEWLRRAAQRGHRATLETVYERYYDACLAESEAISIAFTSWEWVLWCANRAERFEVVKWRLRRHY